MNNRDRNKKVYELYSQSRAELGLRTGQYKEIKVSALMKEKYGINISPESVRKVYSNEKKVH